MSSDPIFGDPLLREAAFDPRDFQFIDLNQNLRCTFLPRLSSIIYKYFVFYLFIWYLGVRGLLERRCSSPYIHASRDFSRCGMPPTRAAPLASYNSNFL